MLQYYSPKIIWQQYLHMISALIQYNAWSKMIPCRQVVVGLPITASRVESFSSQWLHQKRRLSWHWSAELWLSRRQSAFTKWIICTFFVMLSCARAWHRHVRHMLALTHNLQTLICVLVARPRRMFHIVKSCPLTKLNGGLSQLHSADEDAVLWLTSYGSWHAYEKKIDSQL